jgi:hypothetical protein
VAGKPSVAAVSSSFTARTTSGSMQDALCGGGPCIKKERPAKMQERSDCSVRAVLKGDVDAQKRSKII